MFNESNCKHRQFVDDTPSYLGDEHAPMRLAMLVAKQNLVRSAFFLSPDLHFTLELPHLRSLAVTVYPHPR